MNGTQVLSGKVQLKSVTGIGVKYGFRGDNYAVSFVGDNADWFLLLKDKQLGRDLDWTIENHTFDGPTIQSGLNQFPVDGYAYGVIKTKDWANNDGPPDYKNRVSLFECTPLLFIGRILEKAFNSVGYTLLTGFFANPVNERYVLPVILPEKYPQEFSEDYLNIIAEKNVPTLVNSFPVLQGFDFDNQVKTPPISNPFLLSIAPTLPGITAGNTGQYTALNDGFYSFTIRVEVNNIIGTPDLNIGILTTSGSPNGVQYIIGTVTAANNGDIFEVNVIAEMSAGDVAEFFIGVNGINTVDSVELLGNIEVIGEAKISDGSPIDFRYLLNTWKITDFIKGLTAAFNLCWETDADLRTVLCEPKDNYLVTNRATSITAIVPGFHVNNSNDLTPKVDLKKEKRTQAKNEVAEVQQYRWAQDSADKTAEAQNSLEKLPFDSSQYILPLNRFKKDTEENENPFFAPTLMYYDETIRPDGEELTPLIPLLFPDDYTVNRNAEENNVIFKPRILWYGGQRGDDGEFKVIDQNGSPTDFLLPALFFVNYNDPTGLDVSLNWSDLTIRGNLVQGQMRRFYLNDLARKRKGKETELSMYWNEIDILELSFRNKIFINNKLFLLKEINSYSPIIDRSTKTILVYDTAAEQEDVNRIENTLSIGYILDFPLIDE